MSLLPPFGRSLTDQALVSKPKETSTSAVGNDILDANFEEHPFGEQQQQNSSDASTSVIDVAARPRRKLSKQLSKQGFGQQ